MRNYFFTDKATLEDFIVKERSLDNAWETAREFFEEPSFICEVDDYKAEILGIDIY